MSLKLQLFVDDLVVFGSRFGFLQREHAIAGFEFDGQIVQILAELLHALANVNLLVNVLSFFSRKTQK
jgi:hypothetical protein